MAAYDQATLEGIRDKAMTRLSEALDSPKMDYTIDGQTFNWTQYQEMLQKRIDWANAELAKLDGPDMEETLVDM